MKKLFKYLFITLLVALVGIAFAPDELKTKAYASVSRTFTWVAHSFKKSVIIGSTTNSPADSTAWLQIGDTMGARYHLYLPGSDTSAVDTSLRKFGALVFQRSDTCYYVWVGDGFRKIAWQ